MDKQPIIIKRVRRNGGGHGGGGAWKVAFADFTLAMMAFFMVLWILAVSSQEEREIVATRLRDYSILDNEANPFDISNSPYPVDLGGDPSPVEEAKPQRNQLNPNETKQLMRSGSIFRAKSKPGYDSLVKGKVDGNKQMEQLAGFIGSLLEQMEADQNIKLQVVPQGLRILIRDSDEREMYSRGSARISPFFRHLLMVLAPVFDRIENSIMISGHTDNTPFAGDNYTNWELSSDRAMMARRVLVAGGMPSERVAKVVALADTMLDDTDDPGSSRNRRIELLVLSETAEQELAELFSRALSEAKEKTQQQRR